MNQSFGIVLPLRKKTRIDPGDLITEIRLLVEQTGATVRIDPRMMHKAPPKNSLLGFRKAPPETVAFELDGVRLRVSMHPEPFTDRLEMGRYVNPVMWDRGLGEFTDHRAYFKVHEAGIEGEEGPDAVFDRAAAVTATASVVARLSDPVGAIWLSARNSIPMKAFGAAIEDLKDGAAPLAFWLRWHVLPPGEMEELHSGLVTGGLAAFTGRELMVRPSTIETRVMIEHTFDLARRMLDEKLAVSDNQIVETEEGGRLKLRLSSRQRKGEAPVCEIVPLDAPAPKPTVAQLAEEAAKAAEAKAREAFARDAAQAAPEPAAPDSAPEPAPANPFAPEPKRIEPGALAAQPPIQAANDPKRSSKVAATGGVRRVVRMVPTGRSAR